jgi:AraC family transcriptional regulator
MPLETSICGTDKNGFQIEDYCIYCYKDGAFTNDVTMEEMIRLCAQYVKGNSQNYAIANMKIQYPRLKRWARKEETQHAYHKSINQVLLYIQEHLNEPTNLKTLADIVHISPYHFHRIFKSTIGESLAEYVQRLRLEYVAEQLKTSHFSLNELAERAGYSSEQALSRAFKKYFNLPPSVFKASFLEEKFNKELIPRICRVAEKNIIMLRETEPDILSRGSKITDAIEQRNWQKLYMYAMVNRLLSESSESLEIIKDGIFYPALTTTTFLTSDDHVDSVQLSEGTYAIFTHIGNTDRLPELYDAIIHYWLPTSKYVLSSGFPYIKYLNHASVIQESELLSEVYIPLIDKSQLQQKAQ